MKTKIKSTLGHFSKVWYFDIDVMIHDLVQTMLPDGEFFSILGFEVHEGTLYSRLYCDQEYPLLLVELFEELDSDLFYSWEKV